MKLGSFWEGTKEYNSFSRPKHFQGGKIPRVAQVAWRISTTINNVKNQGPQCVEPRDE
jgi:hypothetical protein